MRPVIYHQRNRLEDVEKQPSLLRKRGYRRILRQRSQVIVNIHSTCRHTNSTPFPTMLHPFGCMGQPITTRLRRYAFLMHNFVIRLIPSLFQGELEHRRVKRQYSRAHKGKFAVGIAKQTRRERMLHNIMKRHSHLNVSRKRKHGAFPDKFPTISSNGTTCGNPSIPFSSSEPLSAAPSNQHYQMSTEIRHKVPLSVWLGDNKGDPALKVSHFQWLNLKLISSY